MLPSVSVVVPTYREAENLPGLLARIGAVRAALGLDLDVWIMDDASDDRTPDVVDRAGLPWVNLVVRHGDRGLSRAVIDGMARATGSVIVVMDADLSHAPEVIPDLIAAIADGADFAIGSRYTSGGEFDPDWGFARTLNSRAATLLARPFSTASDPMSGFFAIAADRFRAAADRLNPVGYKIGLELMVKCGCRRIAEIPITFHRRQYGKSKLTLREQLRYLQHLRRLALYRYPNWASVIQFCLVGASGAVINLATVQLLSLAGASDRRAIAGGIGLSVLSNFLLNRRFTFSYALGGSVARQFIGFLAASSLGMLVNYLTATSLRSTVELPLLLAVCGGILAGTGVNFLVNRYLVFTPLSAARPPREH